MVSTQPPPLPRHAAAWLTIGRRHALAPLLAAALLILLGFITTGGVLSEPPNQVPTSWADVALIVAGGAALAALIIQRRTGGGTLSFGLFSAVAVLTIASIAWSVAPDQSWEEAGRTVAYLAAFGIALVGARRGRARATSRGTILAVTLAAQALCVWALAVKVFDLNLYGQPEYGTLLAPFSYWNATGVIGAMALPGSVYLAAGRGTARLTRGLALAGVAIAIAVVALTYSRSAVAAAVCGAVIPLFFLRERRRAVLALTLGLLGSVPIWLFSIEDYDLSANTADNPLYGATGTAPVHRVGAGLILGAIVVAVALILTVAGILLSGYLDRTRQPPRLIRLYDRGLLGLVIAVPVLIVLFLLVNHRGPLGEISHEWRSLTSVYGYDAGGGANRLGSLANSRALYWRQALAVGEHHLLGGSGAGTFYPAYLHYPAALLGYAGQQENHAHSYVMETFATLGLAGIALNLALFGAWWRDAIRSVRRAAAVPASELDARWGLIGIVIAFGVSSALDWTWFFPGVTVPALVAAGWIAGVSSPARSTATLPAAGGPARPPAAPPAPAVDRPRRPLIARPGAIIALTLVAALTLAAAWESLAPMRSVQSAGASLSAQGAGNGTAALADARAAVSDDPLSAAALKQLADVYFAFRGGSGQARTELVKATQVQPDNPQPFVDLGGFLLCSRDFTAAEAPLERATMLDVTDTDYQTQLLADARAHHGPDADPDTQCAEYR